MSKACDTVDHTILSKTIEMYGIMGVRRYLTNRMQYISINRDNKTNEQKTTCSVSQRSILGPLLFLIYINDLLSTSSLLNSIMFADETNTFFEHKDISVLFCQ